MGTKKPRTQIQILNARVNTALFTTMLALIFAIAAMGLANERIVDAETSNINLRNFVTGAATLNTDADHAPLYGYLCSNGVFLSYGLKIADAQGTITIQNAQGGFTAYTNCVIRYANMEEYPTMEEGRKQRIFEVVLGPELTQALTAG